MTHSGAGSPKTPWRKKPGGIAFIHVLRVVLFCYILGPLAASLALWFEDAAITLPLALLAGVVFGGLGTAGGTLPPRVGGRYLLPLAFCWVMLPAFFPFFLAAALGSAHLSDLRFLPAVYVMGLVAGYMFFEQRRKDSVAFSSGGGSPGGFSGPKPDDPSVPDEVCPTELLLKKKER